MEKNINYLKIKNIWNKKHKDRKIVTNKPLNIWRALQ